MASNMVTENLQTRPPVTVPNIYPVPRHWIVCNVLCNEKAPPVWSRWGVWYEWVYESIFRRVHFEQCSRVNLLPAIFGLDIQW